MDKVRFYTGNEAELIGFVNGKIIIRFNNGQSIGTVPKEGWTPVKTTWEELEKKYSEEK